MPDPVTLSYSPPTQEWVRIESVIQNFEESWQHGRHPSIETFLPTDPTERWFALVELVHVDLEYRFKAAEPVSAERYLYRYPELTRDSTVCLDLISREYLLRLRGDPNLDLEEYLDRFPTYKSLLRDRLLRVAGSGVTREQPPQTAEGADARPAETAPPTVVSGSSSPRISEPFAQSVSVDRFLIPGYEILGTLGRGGMGVVYLARHHGLDRLVALKLLLAGELADSATQERFHREAEAVARLQHPNIVQIFDVGGHQGQPFFSLEYCSGGSLSAKLSQAALPAQEAAHLVETLAGAIQVCHEANLVHRDLKPANVLLTTEGNPKITDFGLVKRLDDTALTQTGAVVGTPCYMAPEQVGGRSGRVGPATDIYALGALLYECLTGRPPFKADSSLETIRQVVYEEPVSPRQLCPRLPRDLEVICLKCLRKEPRKRYPSAAALAEDLGRFTRGEPIQARPVSRWERSLKWARRRPLAAALWAVTAVAALSLTAAGLAYSSYQHRLDQAALKELKHEQEESQRKQDARNRTEKLILQGLDALDVQDWQKALHLFSQARDQISQEPSLTDLQPQAEQLLSKVDRGVTARKHAEQFTHWRNDALFQEAFLSDPNLHLPTDVKQARQTARKALDLFPQSAAGRLALDDSLSSSDKENIKDGYYELLLILAGAATRQDPPQPDEGLRLLDQANLLGQRPTRAYHLCRADCLRQLKDVEKAQEEERLAAAQPPVTALDFFLLGVQEQVQGKLPEAVAHFKNALDLQPNHFWAEYFLALCYLRLQQPLAAEATLTACIGQQPADFVWCYLLRGFAHNQLKQFKAAEDDFQRALEVNQKAVGGPNDEATYSIYVNRGVVRARAGKLPQAEEDFKLAIALRPDQYPAYAGLAGVYHQQKEYEEAFAQLSRAIEIAQRQESSALGLLFGQRARLQKDRRETAAALADFEQAIQAPRSPTPEAQSQLAHVHAERGLLLHSLQRYEEALADYETALKIQPDYTDAWRWRGSVLLALSRYPEAIQALDRCLDLGPPRAEAYRDRGLAREKLGNYSEGIADYCRALDLKADPAETRLHRGRAYLQMDAPRLALADFETVIQLDNKVNGYAYIGRGYARVKLGQIAEGVADAEEAVRRGPAEPRLMWAAARIYALACGRLNDSALVRARYQERGFELLRGAIELTPSDERTAFWRDYVAKDPVLNPLRRERSFAQLDAEFSRSAK
jgi:serine/threonine protein kinase/tetratricopeptide (TPR) repeat protein